MRAPAQLQTIPVTIIGGFLGAGKTTLLNHILKQDHGARLAVLVNDFGAINIDAELVVGVEGDVVKLANGCICCNIREDLVAACLGLFQRTPLPDQIIIETSGVADPLQIANSFLQPELQSILPLNSIISVFDCAQYDKLPETIAPLAQAQIAAADLVVLNKVDLIDTAHLGRVRALVRQLSPGARMIEANHGQVPLPVILGAFDNLYQGKAASAATAHHNSNHHGHPSMASWSWTCHKPLSLPKFRSAFEALPTPIYRAKGIVYLEEFPEYRIALQMVGKRSSLVELGRWEGRQPQTQLVLLATKDGVDEDRLSSSFDACIGSGDDTASPLLKLMAELRTNGFSQADAPRQ